MHQLNFDIKVRLSELELNRIKNRFTRLFDALRIPKEKSGPLFLIIQSHYSEPHRAYHNLSHIRSMLDILDIHRSAIKDFSGLEVATWFHDIIYQAPGTSNELRSAEFARHHLLPYCAVAAIERIHQLIISTKTHVPFYNDQDNHLFLDADMAILAAERYQYAIYCKAIRAEYASISDYLFNRGRKKVLNSFLARDQIYYSKQFKLHFEKKARENLMWELDHL